MGRCTAYSVMAGMGLGTGACVELVKRIVRTGPHIPELVELCGNLRVRTQDVPCCMV
jgi:hypothetical protein